MQGVWGSLIEPEFKMHAVCRSLRAGPFSTESGTARGTFLQAMPLKIAGKSY